MTLTDLLSADQPTVPAEPINAALMQFTAVRNRGLRLALSILPMLIVVFLIGIGALILPAPVYDPAQEAWCTAPTFSAKFGLGACIDGQYASGLATAGLTLIIFQMFLARIPITLGALWNRNVLALPAQNNTVGVGAQASTLASAYAEFIRECDRQFNHPRQWICGSVFGAAGISWRAILHSYGQPIFLVGEFMLGMLIGLMAWRVFVLAFQIHRLPNQFDLVPKLLHPDHCAGFKPLGEQALWSALIIALPTTLFTIWTILSPKTLGYISPLAVILLVSAVLSFFLPLWRIHQVMLAKRSVIEYQLEELNNRIDQVARELITQGDGMEADQRDKLVKKLNFMRQVYADHSHLPAWPFDTSILVQLTGSLTVPVLGLLPVSANLQQILKALVQIILPGK